MYCLRTNLSMALVEMTSKKPILLENGTFTRIAEFKWNSHETGIILSAFSYGYVTTIFGGMLATKCGGATIFGSGIFFTALITLFTPLLFRFNSTLFLISRVIEGVFEAASLSSMPELWSRWSPPEERSRLVAFSFTGVYVGLTVSYPISGFVASIWGWPAIFYTTGGMALIWSILWLLIVKNDPTKDVSLSECERIFLMNKTDTKIKKIKFPWKGVLTSAPVWTLCVVEFVFSCGYTFVILYLPMYIKAHLLAGYLADVLRNKKILTPTQIHKLYICVGFFIGAILLNVAVYWPNFSAIISCLCLFRFFTSFSDVAFHVNVIDLAPDLASFLFGITTWFFTLGSMSQEEWSICFSLFSIIYVIGAGLFFYFGSGKLQSWSSKSDEEIRSQDISSVKLKCTTSMPNNFVNNDNRT